MRWIMLLVAVLGLGVAGYWANYRFEAMKGGWLDPGSWLALAGDPGADFDEALGRQLLRNARAFTNPGFEVPARAEPEPTETRQRRAAASLECPAEAIDARPFGPLTEAGADWVETSPPPAELLQAAEAGDPQAQYDLGRGYVFGMTGVSEEEATRVGTEWLLRAAEGGEAKAQAMLGDALLEGLPLDGGGPDLGREYLERATANGDAYAPLRLALLGPDDGETIEAYAERRLDLELTAAARCNAAAESHIALRLADGRGLRRDEALARRILLGWDDPEAE